MSKIDPVGSPVVQGLEFKIRLSRLALAVERAWPLLWLPLGVLGLFLLVSLLEVWALLPALWHQIGLAAFAFASFASVFPLIRLRYPTREEGLRRVETGSGLSHRPASSYEDQLAPISSDAATGTIWQAHKRRLAELVARMRVRSPVPRVERHDPLALRLALVLGLGTTALLTFDSWQDRLRAAFRLSPLATATPVRLDAWVTPPLYTRKPPVMLANGAVPLTADSHEIRALEVPEGSIVVIRASGIGADRYDFTAVGEDGSPLNPAAQAAATGTGATGTAPIAGQPAAGSASAAQADTAGLKDFRIELGASSAVTVLDQGVPRLGWQFNVIDDTVPEIGLTQKPGASPRGSLSLSFKVSDDYGVVSAEARIERADQPAGASDSAAAGGPGNGDAAATGEAKSQQEKPQLEKPLHEKAVQIAEPLSFNLRLPQANPKQAEGQAYQDLAAHPWAGLKVRLTLTARDQAGQIGSSGPIEFKLPMRRFTDPLAKALVEQRRNLVLDPRDRSHVAFALDALTIAPEKFIQDRSVYLGIRSARHRLGFDPSPSGITSVVDQLWKIALRIEDGDLSEAERALREAQDRLSEALERGASDEEISKLTQELRQAMNRFLQTLAQQAQPGQMGQMPPNSRMMTSRDLDQILKNIEDLAKSGSRDMAQQMLNQLRDMMERLQSGRQPNSQASREAREMMDKFGNIIQEQQQLLDETFRQKRRERGQQGEGAEQGQQGQQGRQGQDQRGDRGQQGQRGREGQGQRGEQGQNGDGQNGEQPGGPGELSERQQALREQLNELLEGLRRLGANPPESLEGAGEPMDGATQALRQSDLDQAGEDQTRALEQLRKGAQSMAQQMMQGMSQGMQQGRVGEGGSGDHDPLGRPQSQHGDGLDQNGQRNLVPDALDIQRAREVLDELRRRLGEQGRPAIELDYLERLLRQF